MKRLNWIFVVLAVALCASGSMASAQDATSTTATYPPPPPPSSMVSDTPPEVQEPGGRKPLEVGFTWGISIGVPIILDDPRDVVRPGANINFFGGADFGWFIVGGDAGLQWNPIDLNGQVVDGVVLSGRHPLTRIYLSLPEFRFQVPDLKVVLPYLSAAFDMNFWNFAETGVTCGGYGYWWCGTYSVYRFTPGFTGKAGVAFNINESGVHIDVGFQYSFTGKGNFFERTGWWLSPFVGVLVRTR